MPWKCEKLQSAAAAAMESFPVKREANHRPDALRLSVANGGTQRVAHRLPEAQPA